MPIDFKHRAENYRRWIRDVDFSSADTLGIERKIYEALSNSQVEFRWRYIPIAPLAEPTDLNALVGDNLNDAQVELNIFAKKTDKLYSLMAETNNAFKAELEGLERAVLEATEAVSDISFVSQDQNTQYYWISESFNSTSLIDPSSTAMVDIDRGFVSLSPTQLSNIDTFNVRVDREQTKGIPGCNLLVLNYKTALTPNQEPDPELEASGSYNLSNAFDSDPSTWFEIERNFISPKQKLVRLGKAYKSDATGNLLDIKEATKDLDWRVYIQWPGEDAVDAGPNGSGIYIAEFRDIAASSLTGSTNISTQQFEEGAEAILALELTINEPLQISSLTLNPFNRLDQPIKVEKISVFSEGVEIPIAESVVLNMSKQAGGQVERELLRRTGSSSSGVYFSVPTDRPIEKVRVVLSSPPIQAPHGLAHKFKEQEVRTKTTSTFLGFKSSKHKVFWNRIPLNENPVGIYSKSKTPKLDGILTPLLNIIGVLQLAQAGLSVAGQTATNTGKAQTAAAGQGFLANITAGANLVDSGRILSSGLKNLKLGSQLGKTAAGLGSFLGQALPIIGGAMVVGDLVGSLFGKKTNTVYGDSVVGYDVFNGFRSSVGIRDVTLQQTLYGNESMVVSVMRYFPGPVSKVGLFVDESVPEGWGAGEWITYEVSTNGTEWHQIPKLSETTIDKAYSLPAPSSQIKFRARIRGNQEDPNHTPTVQHITLQGLPV